MRNHQIVSCSTLWLLACGGGPYSTDLNVQRKTTGTSVTTAYQVTDGDDAVERSGTIGSGDNCVVATQSTGTRTSTRTFEIQESFNVVGETQIQLPLVPGDDKAANVWASVIRSRARAGASVETTEAVVDPTAEPAQWQTRTFEDEAITTAAGYYAVAADEFTVRMEMTDLWDDLEEMEPSDVELMTLNGPTKGDVWPSQNGNSIHLWEASEKLALAGVNMNTDRIAVYGTGSVAPEGDDTAVFDQCFNFGLTQSQDSRPDEGNVNADTMLLDAGCVGKFEHVRDGTQWWYDNVLVKEASTVTFVTINEYGYQWTEEDEISGTCTRVVSTVKDNELAVPFVQYDVTVTNLETVVTGYAD